VVGNRPDRKVKSLNGKNGVTVVGYVKDVRDYIAIADVCVIPLHIARGLQNKVLEAMAMGRPVVCTSKAFEGIEAIPGEHLLVADEPAAFAGKVTELLDDNTLASKIGSQARRCVEEKYSWQRNLSILDRLFSKNSSNRDKK
jgi:glycosyltransferase involved in cell wall biosynthesis